MIMPDTTVLTEIMAYSRPVLLYGFAAMLVTPAIVATISQWRAPQPSNQARNASFIVVGVMAVAGLVIAGLA